jgi:hypothetical protein
VSHRREGIIGEGREIVQVPHRREEIIAEGRKIVQLSHRRRRNNSRRKSNSARAT